MLTLGSLSLGSTDPHLSVSHSDLHWLLLSSFWTLTIYRESSVFVYALTQCSLEIQPFPVTKENLILLKTCQNTGY